MVRTGTSIAAGMHTHGEGLIHMEPQSSSDMGENATVGNFFETAGFKLDATSISVPTVDEKNGKKCDGKPGVLRWSVNGKEKKGNPAKYKLFEGDVIVIAFTTADAKLPKQTDVPSYQTLQQQLGEPAAPEPGVTVPPNAATTTTPDASLDTTTTAPTSGSTTTPTSAGTTSTPPP
jgi:hypothetical protein